MKKHLNILVLSIGLFFIPVPSHAFCFKEAGAIYNVPPRLLWTIAKVESDFNPRAINFRTDTDYDFGLMQIHTSWAIKLGNELPRCKQRGIGNITELFTPRGAGY